MIPALSPVVDIVRYGTERDWWWKNELSHPYILFSYANFARYPSLRELIDPRREAYVLADSGGFQVASRGVYFDPVHVVQWQARNADEGIALDVPVKEPVGIFGGKSRSMKFERKAEKTARNTETMVREAKKLGFRILPVLHGLNYQQVEYWFRVAVEPFLEDRLVLSPPPNARLVDMHLSFAYGKGVRDVHVLGVSASYSPGSVIKCWAKRYRRITFDTAGPTVHTFSGHVYSPREGRYIAAGRNGACLSSKDIGCSCPFCQRGWNICERPRIRDYINSSLHNLFWELKVFESLSPSSCPKHRGLEEWL